MNREHGACETVTSGEARTVFGGDGVTPVYPAARRMSNLKSVGIYEGTDEVHTLVLGGAITGIPTFS